MTRVKKLPLLAVVGPTASGKTDLGVELALALGGEVVSADSMQIYRGLTISTAKPTEKERRGVPHHLMGFLPPEAEYSVARFVEDAGRVIADIDARGRLPVLVGGTGLYVDSLLNGLRFADAPGDADLRAALRRQAEERGNDFMHRLLREIDPDYAATLHPNNLGRVLRAIELHRLSGVTMSAQRAASRERPSPYRAAVFGLDYLDRARLYERVDRRVDGMLSAGLLDEAAAFYRDHPSARTAAQAIGCKELRPFLEGTEPLDICVERLKRETRRYAKRQLTWFRRDPRVSWLFCDDPGRTQPLIDAALERYHQCRREKGEDTR